MSESDLNLVLQRLDAIHRELREGFRAIELQAEKHAADREALFATLTGQLAEAVQRLRAALHHIEKRPTITV